MQKRYEAAAHLRMLNLTTPLHLRSSGVTELEFTCLHNSYSMGSYVALCGFSSTLAPSLEEPGKVNLRAYPNGHGGGEMKASWRSRVIAYNRTFTLFSRQSQPN